MTGAWQRAGCIFPGESGPPCHLACEWPTKKQMHRHPPFFPGGIRCKSCGAPPVACLPRSGDFVPTRESPGRMRAHRPHGPICRLGRDPKWCERNLECQTPRGHNLRPSLPTKKNRIPRNAMAAGGCRSCGRCRAFPLWIVCPQNQHSPTGPRFQISVSVYPHLRQFPVSSIWKTLHFAQGGA